MPKEDWSDCSIRGVNVSLHSRAAIRLSPPEQDPASAPVCGRRTPRRPSVRNVTRYGSAAPSATQDLDLFYFQLGDPVGGNRGGKLARGGLCRGLPGEAASPRHRRTQPPAPSKHSPGASKNQIVPISHIMLPMLLAWQGLKNGPHACAQKWPPRLGAFFWA